MAITRAQIARQLYRYGGDTMGGPNDKSNQGPTGGDNNRERGIQASYQEAARRGALKNLATRQAEDKAEEAIEVFRNRNRGGAFNKVLNVIPGIGTVRRIASTFGPLNNRDFFLDRVAPKNFSSLPTSMQQNMFDQYMGARGRNEIDAYGNPIGSDDNDNNQFMFPQMMAQAPSIMEQEPEEPQGLGDLRLAFRAEGGSMNDQIRQAYGLGSIVKKATSAVKKVAKSPIGKAALLYTGAAGLGALGAGTGFAGFKASLLSPSTVLGNLKFTGKKLGLLKQVADYGMTPERIGPLSKLGIGSAITAVSLLPLLGLGTGDESEDEAQAILDQSGLDIAAIRANPNQYLARAFKAEGGSMDEPVAKKTMPLLDMDGQEMDLRAEGGFVPIGRMEKADDVPARLSKNEFVFTAEAVRNAGEGDVDKGAEVMYNMMKNLEAGGDVSEESQGLEGARSMFQTSQRLEEVL